VAAPSDHDVLLALGDDLPVAISVACAPDGELIYTNRAFDELGGTLIYTRDGRRYPEDRMPFARALSARCEVVVDDLSIRRSDGKHVEVRAVARPVGDPITHVVVALFDVSREVAAERARAESERWLHRAQRLEAIGALAGGIAHDFNNLIFSIKLLAAEVTASDHDPKRRAAMQAIDELTERSAALTRSLLGFARRRTRQAMPISLNDIVTSMTELLGRTLAGIELIFELEAAERGTVIGDQSQLEQVIMNLVLHARDAVQRAGRVLVRTRDLQGTPDEVRRIVLEVIDDGPGIPLELRDRVFAQHVAPDAASEHGSGLGLATAFAIVESHGGSLEVGDGLDGRGTTMRVMLPAADRAPAVRERLVAPELPRGSGLVLVIDDDHMVRRVVASALGALGYRTIEASSGDEGIEIYRGLHDEVRAVVLDMMMPGMSGRTIYLALRDIDRNVAVLLMSGHTMNEDIQELLDLGVRSFLSKPYSIGTLARTMAELTQ
jgi:two-component system cell cycle sensor histidine kinase/response regulator CckA